VSSTETRFFRGAVGLLFPAACVTCGGVVEDSPYEFLCATCAREVEHTLPPAAVRFAGPGRDLVLALKYGKAKYVIRDIERIMAESPMLLDHARGAVLVPVPLHSRRQRERGFNQSALIARALARAAGHGTSVVALIQRVIDTPQQASLGRKARPANVKNAFALARGQSLNAASRYLVVDDVVTTGSTLESCAHVLRAGGALTVDVATFGRG
jgi:ComF family protein